MRHFCYSLMLASALSLYPSISSAQPSESRAYQDGARGTVTLPQGDRSFADAVIGYTPGTGRVVDSATNPEKALGAPDFTGDVTDGTFVSLGCDGSIVLQFTDNALVDIDGPDLYVFEVGPRVEGMNLAISEEGERWIDLGEISGGRAEVDIAGSAQADASYRLVRLKDDGVGCDTNYAGADIDAVAAIGSAMRFVLDGSVLFEHDSTGLRDEARATLDELAADIAAAGLDRFRVVGHTDSTGSDDYNAALSVARATAVKDYLGAVDALAGATISAQGRGEAEPIASNATEEGRARNRRVEIVGH